MFLKLVKSIDIMRIFIVIQFMSISQPEWLHSKQKPNIHMYIHIIFFKNINDIIAIMYICGWPFKQSC